MRIQFTKMHGCGNDFIVIDATKVPFSLTSEQIKTLADRHTGIGFDQLLVVETAPDERVDFGYRIFNADGCEVEQCGNGARCFARYVVEHGMTNKHQLRVATKKGVLHCQLHKEGWVRVEMGVPVLDPVGIPFVADHQMPDYPIEVDGSVLHVGAVSLGNPHVVLRVEHILRAPVEAVGIQLGQHERFPEQANVGFMEVVDRAHIELRVFERGVGETQACGSGACAAVVYGRINNWLDEKVTVALPGGDVEVNWDGSSSVWLTGPTETVFSGEIDV